MVGIGFFISIMVLILSFLYDVGEDAELLGRPRNDTELLTAEVGHLQWAMSVQDYVMNEGRIPLEAALDGRRCVFGTWFYGPNRTALEQEVPDLRPLFAVLDQKHLALHQSAGVIRTDMERGESAAAKEHFRTVSLPLLTEVRDLLRNSLALTRGAQSGIVARLEGKLNDITRMAVSASLIFLLAGLTIAVLLVRRICGPLGRLTAAARRVAEGDFMTVDIDQKDEVGQLASAFNIMTGVVKEKLGVSQGIMRGMTIPFASCDLEERLTYVNREMLACWGREGNPEDYVGMSAGEFFYDDAARPTLFSRILSEGKAVTGYAVTRSNFAGQKKHLVMDASPCWISTDTWWERSPCITISAKCTSSAIASRTSTIGYSCPPIRRRTSPRPRPRPLKNCSTS